jgi:hypothetical protein
MPDTYQTYPSAAGGTPDDGSVTDIKVAVGANINAAKLGTGIVANTEFNTLDGVTSSIQIQLNSKEATANKGAVNGYASLDGSGKVPLTQISDAILGQVTYMGTWNASTNSPTLAASPASTTLGDYYVVSVSGTQFSIAFTIGDWIISNGTAWEKVDNTDAVSSVFNRTGVVTANSGDYTASQITNVPAGSIAATDVQAAITELDGDVALKANSASPTFSGTVRISSLGTGIAHLDASGNVSSSLIDNVDVAAGAAIAGTKISPNFGSQNVLTTGTSSATSLAVTGTAGAGFIALPYQNGTPTVLPATLSMYSNFAGDLTFRQQTGHIFIFSTAANTASRLYSFPNLTGTVALTGTSQDWSTTGTSSAASLDVTGTAGAGFITLTNQTSTPTTPTSGLRLWSTPASNLAYRQSNGFDVAFDTLANTTTRVYAFPDLSATVAVTGSSQNWSTTGTSSAASIAATGTTGTGFIELANQSAAPTTPTSGLRLWSGSTSNLAYRQANGFDVAFDTASNTSTRFYTFPDFSGTVAVSGSSQNWSTTGTLGSGLLTATTTGIRTVTGVSSNPNPEMAIRSTGTSASVGGNGSFFINNENDVKVGGFTQSIATDGSSSFNVITTPAGSRTVDRTAPRFTVNGDGSIVSSTSSNTPFNVVSSGLTPNVNIISTSASATNFAAPVLAFCNENNIAAAVVQGFMETNGSGGISLFGTPAGSRTGFRGVPGLIVNGGLNRVEIVGGYGARNFSGYVLTTPNDTVANLIRQAGYIEVASDIGSLGITYFVSDVNLKTNIVPSTVKAIDVIDKMEFIKFDWKPESGSTGTVDVGFNAQQLQSIDERFVNVMSDGKLMLNATTILPHLAKAIQELKKELDSLKSEVETLRSAT